MKKMRLKKWVKELLIILVISIIGLVTMFSLYERAEQINRQHVNNHSYYDYEIENK